MTLYLHIGVPKTGTTSIQAFLGENAPALLKQGILVPTEHFRTNNHSELYGIALATAGSNDPLTSARVAHLIPTNPAGFQANLIRSIREHNGDIVLTSEYLADRLLELEQITALEKICRSACDDIRVVIYVREQADALTSYYPTQVMAGRRRPFAVSLPPVGTDWVQHCLNAVAKADAGDGTDPWTECPPAWLDYFALAERWAAVFGKQNIIVRRFDSRTDAVRDFCEVLGVEANVGEPARAGLSIGRHETETVRRMNNLFPRTIGVSVSQERRSVFSRLQKAFTEVGKTPAYTANELLTLDGVDAVREYFKESNRNLEGSYLQGIAAFSLIAQQKLPGAFIDQADYFSQVFGALWNSALHDAEKSKTQIEKLRAANESLRELVSKLKAQNAALRAKSTGQPPQPVAAKPSET